MSNLRSEIACAINRNSAENGSNTPDWILATYLVRCLEAFDEATKLRDQWCGGRELPADPQTKPLTSFEGALGIPAETSRPMPDAQPIVRDDLGTIHSHDKCGVIEGWMLQIASALGLDTSQGITGSQMHDAIDAIRAAVRAKEKA